MTDNSQCFVCHKKRYILLKCKCDNFFCLIHFDTHGCTFDYLAENKEKLKRDLVEIKSKKIEKI